jgi:hypothetical protein
MSHISKVDQNCQQKNSEFFYLQSFMAATIIMQYMHTYFLLRGFMQHKIY